MYRDYDDELYHYGKTGMKWGHHIYAMAKATAKRADADINDAKTAVYAGIGVAAVGSILGYTGSKIAQKRALKSDKKIIDDAERRYKRGEIDDIE